MSKRNRTEKTKGKRNENMCIAFDKQRRKGKKAHVSLLLLLPTTIPFVVFEVAAIDVVPGWAKIRRIIQNSFKFQMQTVHFFLENAKHFDFHSKLLPRLNLAKFN